MSDSPSLSRTDWPTVALWLAVGVIVSIGGYGLHTVKSQVEASTWIEHTYSVIQVLDRVVSTIAVAESGARGYAIARDEQLLAEVPNAIAQAQEAFGKLRQYTADNGIQSARARTLGPKLERRIELLTEFIERVRDGGSTAIRPESMQLSLDIRHEAAFMVQHEHMLLSQRVAEHQHQNTRVLVVCGGGLLLSMLLVSSAFALSRLESRKRVHAEGELAQRHADTSQLLELSELLQACRHMDEAYDVITRYAPKLFGRELAGALFLLNPSRNWLEARSYFSGYHALDQGMLVLDDCWALRRGSPHVVEPDSPHVVCRHITENPLKRSSLCMPLRGHAELLGMLHLLSPAALTDGFARRINIIAEQLSIALSNLALREKLRNESIRDPLTGLFNRRYTEETFDRELSRAERSRGSLVAMMMDVDHFKRFNDTFGHEAGDKVLREIGGFLRAYTRGGDVASRMGGEELLVILPGAGIEVAGRKAEDIRSAVSKLRIVHGGADVGEVTVSIGIAVFPEHGQTAEDLLRAADAALYEAKHAGRNRVVVAGLEFHRTPA